MSAPEYMRDVFELNPPKQIRLVINRAARSAERRFPRITEERRHDIGQIWTAMRFLGLCEAISVPRLSSCVLKHAAEKWGREHGYAPYVSSVAVTIAAVHWRLPVAPTRGPNFLIGVKRAWPAVYPGRAGQEWGVPADLDYHGEPV